MISASYPTNIPILQPDLSMCFHSVKTQACILDHLKLVMHPISQKKRKRTKRKKKTHGPPSQLNAPE